MHADRLLKLAELLEADAVNPNGIKFDLGLWGSTTEDIDEVDLAADRPDLPYPAVSISCGTKACAMGLAVLSGAFTEFGLYNDAVHAHNILPAIPYGEGGLATGFDAAARLFDIRLEDSEHLFLDGSYPGDEVKGAEGELLVATRIREFVADQQAGGTYP